MEAHESHELIEQSEENRHDSKKWTALIISIMAMILAVNNVGGGNASKEVTRHNIEASNYYAFYQAKSIKQHLLKLAVDRMDDESHNFPINLKPNGPLGLIAFNAFSDRKGQYVNDIARYESDEKSGDGKKQLLEKAKEHEAERDHALKQDPWFDYAEGILQIGIVLLSISILASMPILTMIGGILGLIGTACMLNGFFLFV